MVLGASLHRLAIVCLGCALTLAAAVAQAQLQPIPSLSARVTDLTNTLDANQRQTLESELAALERRKGSQIGVLIVPTTQPEDIAQYAIRVFDAWKLGRKGVDDGVLLVVAKDDHRVRIEVARGLEGAIPDAAAARIIREYITPRFRAGDFFGGIHDATDTLTKLIDGEPLPPQLADDRRSMASDPPPMPLWGRLFVEFLVATFGAFMLRELLSGEAPVRVIRWPIGAIVGAAALYFSGGFGFSLGCALIGFLVGMLPKGGRIAVGGGSGGGSSSGDWSSSSSSSSDSSFSGGGGESGGGGASGSW